MPPSESNSRPANLLALEYDREALRLGPPVTPIIDAHTHINGARAAAIYRDVADTFGVDRCYSMTRLEDLEAVRDVLGDRIRFIAVPDYWADGDWREKLGDSFIRRIERYHELGSRIVKFWSAPRARDEAMKTGDPMLFNLDSPPLRTAMRASRDLGMIFMTHIADPDTWFATKYRDASVYGTKREQYEPLEASLEEFDQPWIAAHFGGWPEDLEFLTGLLDRHANLYLDSSATKWMVRELSRHSRAELGAFLDRFRGRILFGSDIVTDDRHLEPEPVGPEHLPPSPTSSPAEAKELYASRYWALRTLFETEYDGPSSIADPDLEMVDPDRFNASSAPHLRGHALPAEALRWLYHDAAVGLLDPLHAPPCGCPS